MRFEPMRTASAGRKVVAVVVGPILWLVGIAVTAWLLDYSSAIQFGLAVTVGAFLISLILLALLYASRRRRERRYVDRG